MFWKECDAAGGFNQFRFEETGMGYGYIHADNDDAMCWSILNASKARKQSVLLKACKNDPRQRFSMHSGAIWFYNDGDDSRFCVPHTGAGEKVRTRRCYDNILGGQ